jgi:hypothetical protein
MAAHNYAVPFEVVGEPYDYGLPGSKYIEFINEPEHVAHPEPAVHSNMKTH